MVASAASSFRMNACASPTPKISGRYSRRAPVEYYDSSDGSDDDVGASGDDGGVRSSRFRLLDEHERMQEAANVERMIQELQAQRKSRFPPQSARTSGTLRRAATTSTTHDFAPSTSSKSSQAPRASAVSTTEKQCRVSSARSPNILSASLGRAQASSQARDPRTHPSTTTTIRASATSEKFQSYAAKDREDEPETSASTSTSFQKQVLKELQKLKQAQLKDLEAIQQLQREKERAERKARQLEAQFRLSRRSSVSSKTAKHQTLVLDEPNASDDDDDEEEKARNNEQRFGDDDDLGDESLPPPHYDDEGTPAPLTRSPVDGDSDLDFLSSLEPSPMKWARISASATTSKAPPGLSQLEFHSPLSLFTNYTTANCNQRCLCYGCSIESLSPVFTTSRSSRVFFSDDPPEFDDEQHGRSARSRDLTSRAHERDQSSENQKQRAKFVQTWDSRESLDLKTKESTVRQPRKASRSRSPSVTRRISTSSSRAAPHRHSYSRSATEKSGEESSDGGTEVRKSCSFFEEKQKEKEEEARLAIEAAERLERAKKAQPPKQLLERQEQAKIKKDAQLRLLERELNAELSKEKRVKARDVPISTYVIVAAGAPSPVSSSDVSDGTARQPSKITLFVTPEELEAQRKERIRQRSQQLLESAELPPRMALAMNGNGGGAVSNDQQNAMLLTNGATAPTTGTIMMSVKMKKQLAAAAEEEARRQRLKPKPVPDFDHLHAQWEKLVKSRKSATMGSTLNEEGESDETNSRKNTTVSCEFFTSRAAKLAELKAKKAARRQKQLEKEEQERRAQREAQAKPLEKTKTSSSKQKLASSGAGAGVSSSAKPTKADELRVKRVLEKMVQSQKQQEKEAIEAERRQQKMKLAAKRVSAQVRASERSRIEGRSDYVSISEINQVAKQRALEFKRSLKESIEQNKQRILGAVAAKPSLMERFATDLKREEHKKNALEAVVKNVFGKNLGVMKGILTEEEHELARDIVAADEEQDAREEKDDKGGARTSKKLKEEEDDDDSEDEYSDA